jgi:hypothetical protein
MHARPALFKIYHLAMKPRKLIGVEIPLANASGKFKFPNDNLLNGKRITGMTIQDNSANDGYAPSGAVMVANSTIAATQITMRVDSDGKVQSVPLKFFLESSGDRQVRQLEINDFSPSTTDVIIQKTSGGGQNYTTGQSIFLTLEYEDA